VVALQAAELLEAEDTERLALAAVFPADPRKIRRRVVASVNKDCARFDFVGQLVSLGCVFRPNGGRETELAVVHLLNRFLVRLDGHDGYDRAEGFFTHHSHVMRDVRKDSGHKVVAVLGRVGESLVLGRDVLRALLDRLVDVLLDSLRRRFADDRAHVGGLVEGVAELVTGKLFLHGLDKVVVDTLVHVNALDRTARLARVEDGTIDDLTCRPGEVYIWANICGILAAELEADFAVYSACCGFLHCETTGDRTSEADEGDFGGLDELLGLAEIATVEDLEDILVQAGVDESLLHLLDDERGLRRGLDDDAVAREESRDERVDESEVGVL
jgi:hypothetical protein